jgi:hypothetical protein
MMGTSRFSELKRNERAPAVAIGSAGRKRAEFEPSLPARTALAHQRTISELRCVLQNDALDLTVPQITTTISGYRGDRS